MRAKHSFRGPAVHRVAVHGGYGVHRRAPPRAATRRHACCCPLYHPWLIRRGSERQGYWLRPWLCEGAPAVRAARRTAAQRLRRGHCALHHCLLSLVLSGKHACACFSPSPKDYAIAKRDPRLTHSGLQPQFIESARRTRAAHDRWHESVG